MTARKDGQLNYIGGYMKFEDLPENIQIIAANTLSELLKQSYVNKELAEEAANSVKAAFIRLYESN